MLSATHWSQGDSSRNELAIRDLYIYNLDHVKYNMNLFCMFSVDRSFDIIRNVIHYCSMSLVCSLLNDHYFVTNLLTIVWSKNKCKQRNKNKGSGEEEPFEKWCIYSYILSFSNQTPSAFCDDHILSFSLSTNNFFFSSSHLHDYIFNFLYKLNLYNIRYNKQLVSGHVGSTTRPF